MPELDLHEFATGLLQLIDNIEMIKPFRDDMIRRSTKPLPQTVHLARLPVELIRLVCGNDEEQRLLSWVALAQRAVPPDLLRREMKLLIEER